MSCRPSVGPSPRHIVGLIVPANSILVPSGLGLRPARMHEVFSFVYLSFLFFSLFLQGPFLPFLHCFVKQQFLAIFFGCTHVPRLCPSCYLEATDTGSCTTGRYSAVPFRDVYCRLFVTMGCISERRAKVRTSCGSVGT